MYLCVEWLTKVDRKTDPSMAEVRESYLQICPYYNYECRLSINSHYMNGKISRTCYRRQLVCCNYNIKVIISLNGRVVIVWDFSLYYESLL